jgi:hypothetical protein
MVSINSTYDEVYTAYCVAYWQTSAASEDQWLTWDASVSEKSDTQCEQSTGSTILRDFSLSVMSKIKFTQTNCKPMKKLQEW